MRDQDHALVAVRRRLAGDPGELEQLPGRRGCLRHERGRSCATARALASPTAIALSPDGRNVYVTSAGSDGADRGEHLVGEPGRLVDQQNAIRGCS